MVYPINSSTNDRVSLPRRDDQSIGHVTPGIANKTTQLDPRLEQFTNLILNSHSNQTTNLSSQTLNLPSSMDNEFISNNKSIDSCPLPNYSPSHRPLSVVEDPFLIQNQLGPLILPPPLNGSTLSSTPLHPHSSSLAVAATVAGSFRSPTNPELHTTFALTECTSSPSAKSLATTKVDALSKDGETHLAQKGQASIERKSVFGKLFDCRADGKSANGAFGSSECGSGNESECNAHGTGINGKKALGRNPSTKKPTNLSSLVNLKFSSHSSLLAPSHQQSNPPQIKLSKPPKLTFLICILISNKFKLSGLVGKKN
ncbi:hypothetical protein O181_014452 [Austropuccinia psidii MF-1]|uniref:Uncharacterized protein n=1 Tax=Austropuccinia psidii MF-1 TaxID=1389203 RepID=A0A9Q3C1N6_9BASI|nr:hypothetical protein [Austropuccinia psidii MF-1]